MVVEALVVGQVVHGIDGTDGITGNLVHSTVNGSNTCHTAAVVLNCLDGTLGGKAGGDGCHQNQNVLTPDHGLDIVTENNLGIGVIFSIFFITKIAISIKVAKLQNLFQYRRICFKKSFDGTEIIIRYYDKGNSFWGKGKLSVFLHKTKIV